MTRDDILGMLRQHGLTPAKTELGDGLARLDGGRVAEHVYCFTARDGRQLVVKEVRANEAQILQVVAHLRSAVAPPIHCPPLLAQGLVVWDCLEAVPPGPLHPTLALEYARFQNATDDGTVFAEVGVAAKLDKSGHGFYADSFHRCLRGAGEQLERLEGRPWPVLRAIREMVERVGARVEKLSSDFAYAPFAWLHHDFRDENIVGNPPKLVDWGSSYGYGPYLFDIAPYLLESRPAMAAFESESAIHRSRTTGQRHDDLTACAAAALAGFLNWHLGDMLTDGNMDGARTALGRREAQFQNLSSLLAPG